MAKAHRGEQGASAPGAGKFEIVFRLDPTLFDGRFANNGWLQELPKPVTKLTWDNAALMSPKTAEELGISYVHGSSSRFSSTGGEHGHALVDVVELTYLGRRIKAPVWIQPGHADGAITLYLGHGRQHAGRVAEGVGFNAYALRTRDAPWFDSGLEARKLPGEEHALACTQMHHNMEERRPIRTASLEHFKSNPRFAHDLTAAEAQQTEVLEQVPGPEPRGHAEREQKKEEPDRRLVPLTLYSEGDNEFPYDGYKWAMAIDLTTCTGCSACVVACQAENNIPIVGKEEVTRGREMHWLRIDRYFEGDPFDASHVSAHFQPVPCMHCENAPCELVCPGRRHRAQPRRTQRHGLQPLRRHALLLEQLPLQGAAFQFLAVRRLCNRQPEADAQPRCDGAQARRHGEMHLLRAAHPRGRDRGGEG